MFFPKIVLIFVLAVMFLFGSTSTSLAQTTTDPTYHTPKVLVIGYDPANASGDSLANTYFSSAMEGYPSIEFEVLHAQKTIDDFKELSGGKIQYSLVKHLHITTFPTYPNGYSFTVKNYAKCVWGRPEFSPEQCDIQKAQFQYVQFFKDNNICQIANEVKADEIWIYSPPYIMTFEAFMVGPTNGFWVNGPGYVVPGCDKHMIVVNPVYDTPDNMLHSYGHRVEATIDYLMRNFTDADRNLYWERFAARNPATREGSQTFCGNVHFPFNYKYEYDMGSTTRKANNCADFENFATYTNQKETYSCTAWGCNDRGWQKHWMSFIPSRTGSVRITTKDGKTYRFAKDWWFYILYPQRALRSETITLPVASPSIVPSPSIAPSPVPTPSQVPIQSPVPTPSQVPIESPLPTQKPVNQCAGDINGDRAVNLLDYSLFVNAFMKSPIVIPAADINLDSKVNLLDYSLFVSSFGKQCLVQESPPTGVNNPDEEQSF